MPRKPLAARPQAMPRAGADTPKDVASATIAAHLAAFAAAGGKIEVLGTTRVLKRVDDLVAPAKATTTP